MDEWIDRWTGSCMDEFLFFQPLQVSCDAPVFSLEEGCLRSCVAPVCVACDGCISQLELHAIRQLSCSTLFVLTAPMKITVHCMTWIWHGGLAAGFRFIRLLSSRLIGESDRNCRNSTLLQISLALVHNAGWVFTFFFLWSLLFCTPGRCLGSTSSLPPWHDRYSH